MDGGMEAIFDGLDEMLASMSNSRAPASATT
jgi:hypothetical protein